MISWRKLEDGQFESADKRFRIVEASDSVNGNYWELKDCESGNYETVYRGETYKDCIVQALNIQFHLFS